MDTLETQIAVIANDIAHIKSDVAEVKKKLEADYATKAELEPIKKIVYGMVAIILTGVVGALLTLVINK